MDDFNMEPIFINLMFLNEKFLKCRLFLSKKSELKSVSDTVNNVGLEGSQFHELPNCGKGRRAGKLCNCI